MEDNKLKPRIRFKGFTDAWEQRKLGECIKELRSGLSRMLSEQDIGLPVVRANNIENDKLDMTNEVKYWYVNDPQGADTSNYLIAKDDILINFINSEAKMGTAAIVENTPIRDTIYTTNILKMQMNKDCNSYFFLAQTHTKDYIEYIKGISKIAVNQASFTTVDFKNFDIKMPRTAEQNKIGKLFKQIDNLITLHQSKYDKLLNIKKSLLEKMFPKNNKNMPDIRFKGFTDAWEQHKLEELSNIYDGTHQTPKYKSNGIMFLSVENIKNLESEKYISEEDFKNEFKIFPQKDDILMTRIGDIGTTNIVKNNTPKAYYVSLALIKPHSINSHYLNVAIASDFVQHGLKTRSLLTAIPMKINKDQIGLVDIKFPIDTIEQEKIGKVFEYIDNLITLHQRKLEKLNNIKKSLLEKMFV